MIAREITQPSKTEVYSTTDNHPDLNVYRFVPIVACTFTTCTGLTGVAITDTFPVGTPVDGNFTEIELASGKIVVFHR